MRQETTNPCRNRARHGVTKQPAEQLEHAGRLLRPLSRCVARAVPPLHLAMLVFLNGQFVPADQAVVPVSDRGFLLGDGVFETVPVFGGRPFCWRQHLARFESGTRVLGIASPYSTGELNRFANELIRRNDCPESILRLTLTRGSGGRGYSPRNAGPATLVMTLAAAPAKARPESGCWRVIRASARVAPGGVLAGVKHTSRLLNVLARAEAEASGADEALLLTAGDEVVEAAAGNVFCLDRGAVVTPPLAVGALPGITRAIVLGLCGQLKIPAEVRPLRIEGDAFADGMFITLSTRGIVEVSHLDGRQLSRSPITRRLRDAYAGVVDAFRRGEAGDLECLAPFPPSA